MGPTIGLLALLLGASFAMEGLNIATEGEIYLASVRKLAEASSAAVSQETTTTAPISPSSEVISPLPVLSPQPVPSSDHQPPQSPSAPTEQQMYPAEKFGHPPGAEEKTGYQDDARDFVDPREIQQVLREIRDLRSQIRQIANRVRKNASFSDETARLTAISAELDKAQSAISGAVSSGGSAREAMQDFRDSQYWDEINKIRAKVELPREIKQIETSVKRLERLLKVKSLQSIGLNMDAAQTRVSEMRQQITVVQAALSAGNLEEAMEAMQFFHEGGHPGEMEGTIFRIRDIKTMLKRVRDEQIRAEVDKVLQEVIDAFNAGEYRDARETLDEYADDLQRLIQRFFTLRMQQGRNREDSFSRIRNLDALIRAKLDEPDGNQPQRAQ